MTIIRLPHEHDDLDEMLFEVGLRFSSPDDKEFFETFEREVVFACQPKTLFQSLEARYIAMSSWEAQRFREQANGLVELERSKVIDKLLDPKSGYLSEPKKAAKLLDSGMDKISVLGKLGISPAAVDALSMVQAAKSFTILDKLEANRIASRRAGLKELARQQEQDEKRRRAAVVAERKVELIAKKAKRKKMEREAELKFPNRTDVVHFPRAKV